MISRKLIFEFLIEQLEKNEVEIPGEFCIEDLTDAFFDHLKTDFYFWLQMNYDSFFYPFENQDSISWDDVKRKIKITKGED